MDKVIIFGNGLYAQTVYCFLTYDTPCDVAAFTVNREYIRKEEMLGVPVVPFEEVDSSHPPSEYKMVVSVSFQGGNRVREEKYLEAKERGYQLISYVSSKVVKWPGLTIGDNSILSPNTYIGPFATIESNTIVAPSVMISHHVALKDHCFVGPGAVILGGVTVEPYCLIGANSTIREGVTIARECHIGAGVVITANTKEKGVYRVTEPELYKKNGDADGSRIELTSNVRHKENQHRSAKKKGRSALHSRAK